MKCHNCGSENWDAVSLPPECSRNLLVFKCCDCSHSWEENDEDEEDENEA